MEDQIREALEQSLVREHRQSGIRLSRATTYITCLCGAEFTGPDWWSRHLVEESTRAVLGAIPNNEEGLLTSIGAEDGSSLRDLMSRGSN